MPNFQPEPGNFWPDIHREKIPHAQSKLAEHEAKLQYLRTDEARREYGDEHSGMLRFSIARVEEWRTHLEELNYRIDEAIRNRRDKWDHDVL